jgi:hypothetical protein
MTAVIIVTDLINALPGNNSVNTIAFLGGLREMDAVCVTHQSVPLMTELGMKEVTGRW